MVRSLKWSRLIADAGLASRWDGPIDPDISEIIEDSRHAEAGSLFVARSGTRLDGHQFIDQALAGGASAVITERPLDLPGNIASFRVDSARGLAGRLASVLHGVNLLQREGKLQLVGITGTNGKSTSCYVLRSILQRVGAPTALLGTIEYDLIARRLEASMTTPPAAAVMRYLSEAADAGARHAVMEVSSHALDQGRCDGLWFNVGVFSNLTGDHLDYHKDMESYLLAKKRLFDGLDADSTAVVNVDDPAGEQMVADCRARVLRYGLNGSSADVTARMCGITTAGTTFELIAEGKDADAPLVRYPLIGRHNVFNALSAAAAGLALGLTVEQIADGLTTAAPVPGRLQPVRPTNGHDPGFAVLVDYAHTDDALENVLSSIKPLAQGRLIVLFCCGGDRDRSKRPRMAAAVGRWADLIVVTSDNPRTESSKAIIDDVLEGFAAEQHECVIVESDRGAAIALAIRAAQPGDIVVLAGKGHERYQIIGDQTYPFDDVGVAAAVLDQAERV